MSQEIYLYPGDFFGFGTTDTGTGPVSKHKRYHNVGDTVRIEVENIGSICNTVVGG